MKKILVPTDFSKSALKAFLYAKELAKTLGYGLKVVHINTGNLSTNQPLILQSEKSRQEVLTEMLNEFVTLEDVNEKTNILTTQKIETAIYEAINITKKIVLLSEEEEVELLVMGTTGANNALDKMLGSIASSVAQRAHCPVFLIPENVKYQDFENVLYASNYESADEILIESIIDFGNIFRVTMHFVHIEEQDNYENIEDTIFYKLFEKGDPAFSFNIVNIKNRSVMNGLYQYAEENEVDLIVLVNRQRNVLENFFQLSLTKKMARTTTLPLMVFHLLDD
ncbi:MAG: universal stress protein [Saprospiraceae bacterium]